MWSILYTEFTNWQEYYVYEVEGMKWFILVWFGLR